MPEYIFAGSKEHYNIAAGLFKEYAEWLNIDLCFQGFEQELETLEDMYAPPRGCILLCKDGEEFTGCVAVRPKGSGVAELKRMYVKPAYRKSGIGRELLSRSVCFAKEAGYRKMRLDTLNTMQSAISLYEKNGFYQIQAYYHNPEQTAVYFEKVL